MEWRELLDLPARVVRDVHGGIAALTGQCWQCIAGERLAARDARVFPGSTRDDVRAAVQVGLRFIDVARVEGGEDLVTVGVGQHASALGATRDGAEIACGRGVRAARLRAVKADILEHLGSLELTVTAVALRERVTPRYVHMLFEAEGTTFSEFVLGQRLTRAHRMLSDSRFAALTISTIAFAVGFGDLSYFNRTFRRRFGTTPSELRQSRPKDRPPGS